MVGDISHYFQVVTAAIRVTYATFPIRSLIRMLFKPKYLPTFSVFKQLRIDTLLLYDFFSQTLKPTFTGYD